MVAQSLHGQTSNPTIQVVSNYKGWKWDSTVVMQNGIITMATVPAIGGRVMQYDLNNLTSIMVDSSLFGYTYMPTSGGFHNFGGYQDMAFTSECLELATATNTGLWGILCAGYKPDD